MAVRAPGRSRQALEASAGPRLAGTPSGTRSPRTGRVTRTAAVDPRRAAGTPIPASPGIGIGPARPRERPPSTVPDAEPGTADEQRDRLHGARRGPPRPPRPSATAAREIGDSEAAIFDAHLLLLDDPDLVADTRARIEDGAGAARAWADGLDEVEARFAAPPDAYLQARAADVRDVRDQVLRRSAGPPAAAPTSTASSSRPT